MNDVLELSDLNDLKLIVKVYIEVKGIPGGYWTALGLCDRCYKFNKCYGLAKLSKEEWLEFENSPTKLLADLEVTSCCE